MRSIKSSRILAGAEIARFEIETVSGQRISIPAEAGFSHLQFRRFAGCPVCSLHLRSFARRNRDLSARDIREIIFFHASREALLTYHADLPFAIVADPHRQYYRRFGVEYDVRALLHPAALIAMVRGGIAARRAPLPEQALTAFGLPADFLIDARGRVLASKYARHADDQWSVDEVLKLSS